MTAPIFTFNQTGWCNEATIAASPNFNARPDNTEIDLLVIHNISLPPDEFGGAYIQDFFRNDLDCNAHPYFEQLKNLRVSAHFLIRRDGDLIQFVSTLHRAWHAGESSHLGRESCNDFSIGIELEGSDHQPFSREQYTSLTALTKAIKQSFPIIDIVGHADIAPLRKSDPGPFFNWDEYKSTL